MELRQESSILDFGSGKLTVLVGARGVNGSINLLGTGEAQYGGFMNGEFLEPEKLKEAIAYAINNAETTSRIRIKQLFVGMPGEFTAAVVNDANLNFAKKRRVCTGDVDELFAIGRENIEGDNVYEIINQGAVYFQTDDDRQTVTPEGLTTGKLSARLSYVLGERRFIELVRRILTELDIKDTEFVSGTLAEALYLFTPEQRDRCALLLDVGYITSTLALARGDGLVNLQSFSLGGAHITGDLMTVLEMAEFGDAERLKRKIILSLDVTDEDVYEITVKDARATFPAAKVNEIASDRIKMIADVVNRCLLLKESDYPKYIPLHLTGGGLAYIKGGKELLAKLINKPVELVTSNQPMLNRPYLSSPLGVLNMAINQTPEPVRVSLLGRIVRKIRGGERH
jgi:cell division protein FtsA